MSMGKGIVSRKGIGTCGVRRASSSDGLAAQVNLACTLWLKKRGLMVNVNDLMYGKRRGEWKDDNNARASKTEDR
jgi:hypothetical protein